MEKIEFFAQLGTYPKVGDVQNHVIDLLGEDAPDQIILSKMSHESVIRKFHEGKLKGIDDCMKLFGNAFFYSSSLVTKKGEIKEVIAKMSSSEVVIFINWVLYSVFLLH